MPISVQQHSTGTREKARRYEAQCPGGQSEATDDQIQKMCPEHDREKLLTLSLDELRSGTNWKRKTTGRSNPLAGRTERRTLSTLDSKTDHPKIRNVARSRLRGEAIMT
jgi:hypothetical protein